LKLIKETQMADIDSIESATKQGRDIAVDLAAAYAQNPALQPVNDLELVMIETEGLLIAFDELAGDSAPSWLFVVRSQFRRLEASINLVSDAVRVAAAAKP
jgi:hypothetical protein